MDFFHLQNMTLPPRVLIASSLIHTSYLIDCSSCGRLEVCRLHDHLLGNSLAWISNEKTGYVSKRRSSYDLCFTETYRNVPYLFTLERFSTKIFNTAHNSLDSFSLSTKQHSQYPALQSRTSH